MFAISILAVPSCYLKLSFVGIYNELSDQRSFQLGRHKKIPVGFIQLLGVKNYNYVFIAFKNSIVIFPSIVNFRVKRLQSIFNQFHYLIKCYTSKRYSRRNKNAHMLYGKWTKSIPMPSNNKYFLSGYTKSILSKKEKTLFIGSI